MNYRICGICFLHDVLREITASLFLRAQTGTVARLISGSPEDGAMFFATEQIARIETLLVAPLGTCEIALPAMLRRAIAMIRYSTHTALRHAAFWVITPQNCLA